jgi:hypothetical protein
MVKEFRLGAVLGRSLLVLWSNLVPFMIIAIAVNVPLFAYSLHFLSTLQDLPPDENRDAALKFTVITLLLGALLSPITTGAITYGVIQQLRGKPSSIAECISVGFSRLLPVLLVAIVVGFAVMGGLALLVVPGLMAACALFVAAPSAVVERGGVRASIARSRKLTRGHRWKLLGVIVILAIIEKAIERLLEIAARDSPTFTGIPYMGVSMFFSLVIEAWQSTAAAISYYYLRSLKESVDIEAVASVFD